jgi:hypothetical protein
MGGRYRLAGEGETIAMTIAMTIEKFATHIGSTVALVIGYLALAAGLATVGSGKYANNSFEPGSSTIQAGIVIILGAHAYRSAKKRRIGQVADTWLRVSFEIAALVVACLVIVMQNHLDYLIATDPVPHFVIPVWLLVAYVVNAFMPQRTPAASKRIEPRFTEGER